MSLDSIFLNHFAFGALFPSPAQVVAHQIIISGLWSHSSFIKLLYRVSFFILKPTKKNHSFLRYLTSLLSLLFFSLSPSRNAATSLHSTCKCHTLSFLLYTLLVSFLYYFALPFLFTYLYSMCIAQCYRSVSVSLRLIATSQYIM